MKIKQCMAKSKSNSPHPLPLSLSQINSFSPTFLHRKTYEGVEGHGVWFETILHFHKYRTCNSLENDLGPGFIPPSSIVYMWHALVANNKIHIFGLQFKG